LFNIGPKLLSIAGTNNLQQNHIQLLNESDVIDANVLAASSVVSSKCKGNTATSKSRNASNATPIHMSSNNSSINRTNNNQQQLAPGAPSSNQLFNNNNNQQNISQYGNSNSSNSNANSNTSNSNNNYSNQNNLNNNFSMVAAGQQGGGMDVGYNSQV
jgi:hypothetical protein